MFKTLSDSIAEYFTRQNIISGEEADSYAYGFHIIFISSVNWGIILLIMLLTHTIRETLLYIASVVILRHHTGGFHADTHLKCCIASILLYLFVLSYIRIIGNIAGMIITPALIITALIIIFKLAPIIHKNNPIKPERVKHHRVCSIVIALITAAAATVCLLLKLLSLAYSLSLGMFQVSMFLLIEYILKRRRSISHET